LNSFITAIDATIEATDLFLHLTGEYQGREGQQVAQYYVDVLDDEQMDVMCIFPFYVGRCLEAASCFAYLHCCSTSAISSALAFLQELERDTILLLP